MAKQDGANLGVHKVLHAPELGGQVLGEIHRPPRCRLVSPKYASPFCCVPGVNYVGGRIASTGGGRGAASQLAPVARESGGGSWRLFGFDRQGWIQAIGGLVIGLIALYSS